MVSRKALSLAAAPAPAWLFSALSNNPPIKGGASALPFAASRGQPRPHQPAAEQSPLFFRRPPPIVAHAPLLGWGGSGGGREVGGSA